MKSAKPDPTMLFEEIAESAKECELTSIVLAAENYREGYDRIELRPRTKKEYDIPMCYSRRMPFNGKPVFLHHIIYSKTTNPEWRSKRRLDCAHELGHIVLHNKALRNGERIETTKEIEADWFALCLLQIHGHVDKQGRWLFPEYKAASPPD
jgi:hypothetical protein